jgi:hypothetical protein
VLDLQRAGVAFRVRSEWFRRTDSRRTWCDLPSSTEKAVQATFHAATESVVGREGSGSGSGQIPVGFGSCGFGFRDGFSPITFGFGFGFSIGFGFGFGFSPVDIPWISEINHL